jgi:chromosome segregation ATPase
MKTRNFSLHLGIGLLIGLLIVPAPPVQAQWTVFDPTQYALQMQKKIEEATRWLETVKQYATMVDKTVQQLSTMQGVLRTVEEQVARNTKLVRLISSVGQIVRGSYQLERQLEGMIRYRINMLKSIDDRLRAGIFNPEADLNDLENYLKYTIGRSAQDTVAKLDKQARNDSQLESWCLRRAQIQEKLAIARDIRDKAQVQLETEKNKPDPDQANMAHLNDVILQQWSRIAELEQEHAQLQDKITERAAKYGLRLQDMENFAFSIITVNNGWSSLQHTKDQIEQTLNNLIINAQPRP